MFHAAMPGMAQIVGRMLVDRRHDAAAADDVETNGEAAWDIFALAKARYDARCRGRCFGRRYCTR